MDIPAAATKLNVLVHGYNVSDSQVTQTSPGQTAIFPSWFKRQYWSGLPVMMSQGNVQTVGISWNGNVDQYNWPDDEFSALLNGPPLANFIATQAAAGRTVTFVAHSLGNMVVNSAINRLIQYSSGMRVTATQATDATQGLHAITSYVMNEAAIPSEAFDPLSISASNPDLANNAITNDGYSNDQVWHDQWNNTFTDAQDAKWTGILNDPKYVTLPQPLYYLRWRQQRPSTGVPDSAAADSTPQRGPWLGYFAANPKNVTITNTVNANDYVVTRVWDLGQYCDKPNIKVATSIPSSISNCFSIINQTTGQVDDASQQFWGGLKNTDAGEEVTWGAGCTTIGTCAHANITRRFAELSYWFPSISYAEGSGGRSYSNDSPPPPPVTNTVTTFDFTPYSPAFSYSLGTYFSGNTQTHSYMAQQPYSIVSPAWNQVKHALCPTCN